MKFLAQIYKEFVGLFIDDLAFAVVIVVWLFIAFFDFPLINLASMTKGLVLTLGLSLILLESVIRYARGKK